MLTGALARLGAVQIPVMPAQGAGHLEFAARQTGASLLVVTPELNAQPCPAAAPGRSSRLS